MLILKHYAILLVFLFKCSVSVRQINNVCKNYLAYFAIYENNEDCYYNSDVFATAHDLLRKYVGHFESYQITTEDGYILTVFRIPRKNARGVVVLNHAVLTDSIIFMGQHNQSLAFQFWNRGYEVWLPNSRGTVLSDKHVSLNSSQEEYWNFSYHEIGYYDYASTIRLVKNITGRNDLIVLGHSMGTTAGFVYASLRPEESMNSVKLYIHFSPSIIFQNIYSPTKYLALFLPLIMNFFKSVHVASVCEYDSLIGILLHILVVLPFKTIIVYFTLFVAGWTPEEFDIELVNLIGSQNPRGAALKILFHYGQAVISGGKFQQFDYGAKTNLQIYNSTIPPDYPISTIKVPTYMISSTSDSIGTAKDAEIIYNMLPKEATIYGKHIISGMNHIDYLIGKSRITKVYDKMFELLDKIT